MGYAHYIDPSGREAGYGVAATCDYPGCKTKIDRGLAYRCGLHTNDEIGCGKFFCVEHRVGLELCVDCAKLVPACEECGDDVTDGQKLCEGCR